MKLYAQLHAEAKIGSQGREEYYGNKTKYYFNLWCDTRNTIRAMAKIHGGAKWDPFKLDVSRLDENKGPDDNWNFFLRAAIVETPLSNLYYANSSYSDEIGYGIYAFEKMRDTCEGCWPTYEAPEEGYWCSPLDLKQENDLVARLGFSPAGGMERNKGGRIQRGFDLDSIESPRLPFEFDARSSLHLLADPTGANGPIAIERELPLVHFRRESCTLD